MITDKLSIGYILRKWLILLGIAMLTFFSFSSVLAQESSPSGSIPNQGRPFIDDNGDGIDDFEQGTGQYADPAVRAKIYGVEFPVADLGGCGSYFECRSFCEDPVNGTTCINYGKAKGFYKDDPVVLEKDKILGEAKRRLGCDSYESCLNFCEIPANFDTCNSFAKSQGIPAGVVADPGREEIITKAKAVLGCDSANSCQAFCLEQDNISKCKSFAQAVGLRGGEHRVGPGGCQSEGTCKSFCSDPNNFQVCKGFTEVSGGTFSGPGGCNSAEGCFTYCQQNPTSCGYREGEDPTKGIAPGGGYYNPLEMCNRTPNCAWSGNACACGYYGETKETVQKAQEYAGYCRANPEVCPQGRAPEILGNSEKRQEFEDFCRTNPDKCRPPAEQASTVTYGRYGGYYYGGGNAGAPNPAAECGRYGCTWSGSACQCSAATVGTYVPPAFTERNPESSCTSGGCRWTGSSCDCSSVSQDSPALACGRQTGCSWINSSCQCGGASSQGAGGYIVPPSYVPAGGSGSGYSEDPAAACSRAPGCSWNGSSCQCSTPGGGTTTYTPPSGYSPSGGGYSGGSYSGSSGSYSGGGTYPGGTYPGSGGSYTPPSSGSYTPPASGSYTTPSSGSYTPPSSGGTYSPPSSGSYTPPSSGSYTAPSSGSYTPPSGGDSGGSSTPSAPSGGDSGSSAPSAPSGGDSGGSSTPSAPSGGDSGGSMPTAPAPTVQGVNAVRGLVQTLIDFLQGK